MPSPTGTPTKNRCGSCRSCVVACPRGGLKGATFLDHPRDVADAANVKNCGALVNRIWPYGFMCCECMLACPVG